MHISQHERKVNVLDAIPIVEPSMVLSVASVVGHIARPEVTLEHVHGARGVGTDRPAVLWVVVAHAVQKVITVDSLISIDFVLYSLGLDRSQVGPVFELTSLIFGETVECFILLDFVNWSELVAIFWNCLALVVNGSNGD